MRHEPAQAGCDSGVTGTAGGVSPGSGTRGPSCTLPLTLLTAEPQPSLCSPHKLPSPACVSPPPPKFSVNSTAMPSPSMHCRVLHSHPSCGSHPGLSASLGLSLPPQGPRPVTHLRGKPGISQGFFSTDLMAAVGGLGRNVGSDAG